MTDRRGLRHPALQPRLTRRALVLDCPELRPLATLPPPYDAAPLDWPALAARVRRELPSAVAIVHPLAPDGGSAADTRDPPPLFGHVPDPNPPGP